MTQDVRDGSHAFLYKKGSEFKPLGLNTWNQLHAFIAWGAVGPTAPQRHKTQRGTYQAKGLL